MTKADIRASVRPFRERAAQLPAAGIETAANALLENLCRIPVWREARCPCIYVSLPGEAPTGAILNGIFHRRSPVLVPRVNGDELELREVCGASALVPGAFGILEPLLSAPLVAPEAADCVIVPGVAFDAVGGRVGRGRGFYDRLLARIPAVPRIALAWEWQVLGRVPVTAQDIGMDWLVTPERILCCRNVAGGETA